MLDVLTSFGLINSMFLALFSRPFRIHDFDLSGAKDIERSVNPMLKQWRGVGRSVDLGLLSRSRQSLD